MKTLTRHPNPTAETCWAQIQEFSLNLAESAKEFDRQMAEAAKESKRETEEIKRIQKENARMIGGISNSNGEVAESYFINSFEKKLYFAKQDYDHFSPNLRKKSKKLNLQGEYDLVMYNCTSVAIIEIKYKAKKEDVEPLLLKAQTFKQLFPEYANYTLYLGLAGLHVNVTAEKEAIKQGIAVIKQVGENMVINDTYLKAF